MREMTESEIVAVIEEAKKLIPTPTDVFNEALASVPDNKKQPTYVRNHFSDSLGLAADTAYDLFLAYQKKAINSVITSFMEKYKNELSRASTREVLETFMPLAMEFEFRVSQMRKSRAGLTFEMITQFFLEKAGVSSEIAARSVRAKLHRMDIVVPNQTVALKTPDRAAFLSLKHTLRERWKQQLPDKNRNWIMFMITLDDDIPDKKAVEMEQHNLIVYVKDEVKAKSYLSRKGWIRPLSDLPNELKRFC